MGLAGGGLRGRPLWMVTLDAHYGFSNSGSLAMLTAIRRAVDSAATASDTATALKLDRGAWHRAVRAEDTTVTCLWAEQGAASFTHIEDPASVCWHFFDLLMPAVRTSDSGMKLGLHGRSQCSRRRSTAGFVAHGLRNMSGSLAMLAASTEVGGSRLRGYAAARQGA